MAHQKGKEAEAAVQKWLNERSAAELGFAWHRIPDAKAARNALAAQPSDYMISRKTPTQRTFWLLEAKEMTELIRLPKDKIRQYGKLKLWWYAGAIPLVPVMSTKTKMWRCLTADDLFVPNEADTPRSFDLRNLRVFNTINELLTAHILQQA